MTEVSRRPHPPVPFPVRRRRRYALIFVLATATGIAAVATVIWRSSGSLDAFRALIPVLFALAVIVSHRTVALNLVFVVLTFTSVGWYLGEPGIGLAAGLAFGVYAMVRTRRLPADLRSQTITMGPPDAVGAGAEEFIVEFERLGYSQVGALTSPVGGHELVISLMAGNDNDRYASVTDAVVTITSTFGSRSLVTRNSARSRMPPGMLDNPLRGAGPEELDAIHSEALALIAPFARPDPLDAETITCRALVSEREHIDWARSQPTHLQPRNRVEGGPLGSYPSPELPIAAWLATPEGA